MLTPVRSTSIGTASLGNCFKRSLSTLGNAAAVCTLIETLYASRAELGAGRFDALLGRVRETLRASIDRRMEYAA